MIQFPILIYLVNMATLFRILSTVSLICSLSAYKLPKGSAKISLVGQSDVVLEDRFEIPHSRHPDVGLKVVSVINNIFPLSFFSY